MIGAVTLDCHYSSSLPHSPYSHSYNDTFSHSCNESSSSRYHNSQPAEVRTRALSLPASANSRKATSLSGSVNFNKDQVRLPPIGVNATPTSRRHSEVSEAATSSYSIAQEQGVELAEKSFCSRLAAFAFATLGVGLSVLSVIFSGGAALPIGIAVVVGVVAIFLVSDTITAYVDWRMKLHGGEGLALGADSIGNCMYWIFQKVGINKESAFKWARRISIPNRVVFTIANLLIGAPGAGLDFALSKPNPPEFIEDEVQQLTQRVNELEQMKTKLIDYSEKLVDDTFSCFERFNPRDIPLEQASKDYKDCVINTLEALEEAKKRLKEAEIKVAKKRFFAKLLTTVVIIIGVGMATFGTISSGGLIAPLLLLSIGMACKSFADTCCAFGHWQSLKHGGGGLPEQQDSIGNFINFTLTNCGCKPETAHRWASRVSTVSNVALPIFQLWPMAQLPDGFCKSEEEVEQLEYRMQDAVEEGDEEVSYWEEFEQIYARIREQAHQQSERVEKQQYIEALTEQIVVDIEAN